VDSPNGVNLSVQSCCIQARNDLEAVRFYLARYQDQPQTLRLSQKELYAGSLVGCEAADPSANKSAKKFFDYPIFKTIYVYNQRLVITMKRQTSRQNV
jgi:hypothetical protein